MFPKRSMETEKDKTVWKIILIILKEMVNYSKNNILAQAGQSMLAQANQSNQGVLSLLQ